MFALLVLAWPTALEKPAVLMDVTANVEVVESASFAIPLLVYARFVLVRAKLVEKMMVVETLAIV